MRRNLQINFLRNCFTIRKNYELNNALILFPSYLTGKKFMVQHSLNFLLFCKKSNPKKIIAQTPGSRLPLFVVFFCSLKKIVITRAYAFQRKARNVTQKKKENPNNVMTSKKLIDRGLRWKTKLLFFVTFRNTLFFLFT